MTAKDSSSDRDARRKAALRDNLKRRKQAARKAREEGGDTPSQKRGDDKA
ncbi:MAG: hypothetical protein RIB03_00080 [Henriciella sp.]|nr:hypothetical protein [Henriciella sp.]